MVSSASAVYVFFPSSNNMDVAETDDTVNEPKVEYVGEQRWHYMVPLEVSAGFMEREDCIVSISLNVTKEIGGYGEFDTNSVRLHETNDT